MNRPDLAREAAGPLPHYASNEQMILTQGVQSHSSVPRSLRELLEWTE